MKKTSLLLFLCFWFNFSIAQTPPKYYKVELSAEPGLFTQLVDIGIYVDHYHEGDNHGVVMVLDEMELQELQSSDIGFEILVEDLSKVIEERNIMDLAAYQQSLNARSAPDGFGFGSMGGFYTNDEIIDKLDEMRTNFPSLITEKFSIGQTFEGRDIWAVKISDNPDTDESATETAVHYDALHHCREPMAMAVTINFMFWLLENYATDDEVQYLVDSKEMFFVPVVNVDGYVYNELINPNGGGLWRKNRRTYPGQSCVGVDLNRNYSYQWGLNSGSSSDCNSNTFRGPTAFSEPESQAIRDFVLLHDPPIAFSTHSFAGRTLQAYGYTPDPIDYENYAEFSLELYEENDYAYGVTGNMLGYTSSGTTRDWMYGDRGAYAWTPEIAGSGFWPQLNEILPIVAENIYPMKKLAWMAGAYPDIKNIHLVNNPSLLPGNTESINVEIFNQGLRESTSNLILKLNVINGPAMVLNSEISMDDIPERSNGSISDNPFNIQINNDASLGAEVTFELIVEMEGVEVTKEFVKYYIGEKNTLLHDDAENGMVNFVSTGNGMSWDTSFVDSRSGSTCFADSRYGNSSNNTNNRIAMTNNVSLVGTEKPILSYFAKWAIEDGEDVARVQISTNNGGTYVTLAGEQTTTVFGAPGYTGNQTWVQENIDLSPYIGEEIRIRFTMITDFSVPADGFHFDDFDISDYGLSLAVPGCTDPNAHNYNPNATMDDGSCETCSDNILNGDETGVDCGGALCVPCCTVEILNVIVEDALCGANTGQAQVIAANGVSPYTYSINGVDFQNSDTFLDLVPNSYTAYVKDADDCLTEQGFEIENGLPLDFDVLTTPTSCGMEDGSIMVIVNGGVPPLTYSIDGINFQANPNFIDLSADDYLVYTRDGQGCESSQQATVSPSGIATISTMTTPASCGASNGQIIVNAEGGLEPYTYSLNDSPFQASNTFNNVSAGGYEVKVLDADECLSIANGQLSDLGDAQLEVEIKHTTCGDANGKITVSATAGLAPFQYSLDGTTYSDINVFENLIPGEYEAYLKDANACIAFQPNIIIEDSEPVAATLSVTPISCFGANDGRVEFSLDRGTTPYLYSLNGSDFVEQNIYENLVPGNYRVDMIDANDCTYFITFGIEDPDSLSVSITLENDQLIPMVEGGTIGYTYLWSDGSMEEVLNNPDNTIYTLTVTDANQCEAFGTFDATTSLYQNYLDPFVKTFPNPSDEIIKVEIDNLSWFDQIELFNSNGQRVLQLPIDQEKLEISVAQFNAGTYLLRLKGQEHLVRKVIIY